MNYLAHVIGGLLIGISLFLLAGSISLGNLTSFVIFLLFVYVGSMMPDTDCDNSRPTKIMFTTLLFVFPLAFFLKLGTIGIVYGLIAFLVACIIYKVIKPAHRGFTHSISFMLLTASIIFVLTNNNWNMLEIFSSLSGNMAVLGYIVGNISHLLLDGEIKWK